MTPLYTEPRKDPKRTGVEGARSPGERPERLGREVGPQKVRSEEMEGGDEREWQKVK